MNTINTMATYDDIRSSLCENIWYLSESELVQKLQSIQIDPEVLATTAENGLTSTSLQGPADLENSAKYLLTWIQLS